jgi:hypothetical protein
MKQRKKRREFYSREKWFGQGKSERSAFVLEQGEKDVWKVAQGGT